MVLDAKTFSAERVSPFYFEGDRQEAALREAAEVVTLKGEHGQRLSGLHFNRDYTTGLAIVWLTGMFEDLNGPAQRYTGYQLAAANPENPVLVINIPAHGGSDPLTAGQRREILKDKQVGLVAGSQAVAARTRLPGVNQIMGSGQSAGARLLPDFIVKAKELGIEPMALVGFNMAGLDKRPSIATALAFIVDGYLLQYKYHRGTANQKLDKAMQGFQDDMQRQGFHGGHNPVVNDYRIFRDEPSYLAWLFGSSPLSAGNGFAAIERAMDLNPYMQAQLVSSGLDKVTRWRRIEHQVGQLVEVYGDRMDWSVWPRDGHAMGIGPQLPRQSAAIKAVVDSLAA